MLDFYVLNAKKLMLIFVPPCIMQIFISLFATEFKHDWENTALLRVLTVVVFNVKSMSLTLNID